MSDDATVTDAPVPPKRGRPRLKHPKQLVSLRLDPDLLEALRALPGWQTKVNAVLRQALAKGKI